MPPTAPSEEPYTSSNDPAPTSLLGMRGSGNPENLSDNPPFTGKRSDHAIRRGRQDLYSISPRRRCTLKKKNYTSSMGARSTPYTLPPSSGSGGEDVRESVMRHVMFNNARVHLGMHGGLLRCENACMISDSRYEERPLPGDANLALVSEMAVSGASYTSALNAQSLVESVGGNYLPPCSTRLPSPENLVDMEVDPSPTIQISVDAPTSSNSQAYDNGEDSRLPGSSAMPK